MIAVLKAERDRCHARLEIDHHFVLSGEDLVRVEVPIEKRDSECDGIFCRDATIAELEAELATARKEMAAMREGVELKPITNADYARVVSKILRLVSLEMGGLVQGMWNPHFCKAEASPEAIYRLQEILDGFYAGFYRRAPQEPSDG